MKSDRVIDKVCDLLQSRSKLGVVKYGTTLADSHADHRARLHHALEEALDLANYLMWSIMEIDDADQVEQQLTLYNFGGCAMRNLD